MSAYGSAPRYQSTDVQRATLTGRLRVAQGIRDRYRASEDHARADRWSRTVDELLDMLGEVQGRVPDSPNSEEADRG